MKLGTMECDFPIGLAPMAGFSDRIFRALCREQGADFAYTEMVSAKGLFYGGAATDGLLVTGEDDRPLIVQLFGREPEIVAAMARRVYDALGSGLLAIDLNMGCPAPKITGNGEGSALMNEPRTAARVIEACAGAVPVPVTVKFRAGWDEAYITAVPFARMCEESGARMLALHPRTRAQQYAGRADWALIGAVKAAVRIPVLGSGDVRCGADAVRMRAQTGCDGALVGRGALGNPFVFGEIRAALRGEAYAPPTAEARRDMLLRHAAAETAEKGKRGIVELRKHLSFYLRGTPGAASLRARLNQCETLEELEEITRRGEGTETE